jgi:hypothetical protein
MYEDMQNDPDIRYWMLHKEELIATHPDQWILIANGIVVGIDPSKEKLLSLVDCDCLLRRIV